MTRLHFASALVFAACIAAPCCIDAQSRPRIEINAARTLDDLKEGAKIRLGLHGADPGARVPARLVGFGQTTMIVEIDQARRELPFSTVIILEEAYRDRKRGAIAGALVAVAGVYIWDFFGPHPKYRDQGKRYKENAIALAISVPATGVIGAAVGWPRWRPIATLGR